jgi:hypothetical protein
MSFKDIDPFVLFIALTFSWQPFQAAYCHRLWQLGIANPHEKSMHHMNAHVAAIAYLESSANKSCRRIIGINKLTDCCYIGVHTLSIPFPDEDR